MASLFRARLRLCLRISCFHLRGFAALRFECENASCETGGFTQRRKGAKNRKGDGGRASKPQESFPFSTSMRDTVFRPRTLRTAAVGLCTLAGRGKSTG